MSVTANGFSGFTSIVTSITVGLTLLYATDLLFYLPQATLGVIIILAVLPLIEFRKMKEMYKDNTKEGIVTWATFFSTILFPILNLEIYEGITTHILTCSVFGFVLSLILDKFVRN